MLGQGNCHSLAGELWGWEMVGWAQNHSLGFFPPAPSSIMSFLVTLADHLVSVISFHCIRGAAPSPAAQLPWCLPVT